MNTIGWKKTVISVEDYLDKLFPNPKCELEYNKDYELLIAVVLSAQTTDKQVNKVTKILFDKYKTLKELSNADINDIEEIIKPIGTYSKKALFIKEISNYLLNECDGKVPNDREKLLKIKGVGRKTINVVLSNLFNENCLAVDTHVTRVSKRLGIAKEKDDVLTIEQKLGKYYKYINLGKRHHQMVLFGRYKCKAKNPMCIDCMLKDICKEHKKNSTI